MKNFLKWIGILTVANFAGLLIIPFGYMATKWDGFWSGSVVILVCSMTAPWLYSFIGGLIGGILKMTETQHMWYMLLTVISVIFHIYNISDISASLTVKTVLLGAWPIYAFLISPALFDDYV